ncbi:hypothetical protein Tco_1370895 [Tanacetum coccineum]
MAYGTVPDALKEYLQMGATIARDNLVHFCNAVMELYGREYLRSGPGPKLLTPRTIGSGLVQNIPSSALYVSPTKNDWEILFQPMFDEYLNPPPSVDPQVPAVIALEPVV